MPSAWSLAGRPGSVQTEAIHVACCEACPTQASSALSFSAGIGLPDPGTSTRSGAVSESSVPVGDTTRPASALTGSGAFATK